jgi:hypothetical protein
MRLFLKMVKARLSFTAKQYLQNFRAKGTFRGALDKELSLLVALERVSNHGIVIV